MLNVNAIAKSYSRLTPEERFRLILAAGARGDDAEQNRLAGAGRRIRFSMQDHAPYAHAFNEMARLTFIELLELAAKYLDTFHLAGSEEENGATVEGGAGADTEGPDEAAEDPAEGDAGECSAWSEPFGLALAAGFLLKTWAAGWNLFCSRMNVPPDATWKLLPGFDRLQRALRVAEQAAFVPEGFLRWLNAVRPADEPELTAVPPTGESIADAIERTFRERVAWWGG